MSDDYMREFYEVTWGTERLVIPDEPLHILRQSVEISDEPWLIFRDAIEYAEERGWKPDVGRRWHALGWDAFVYKLDADGLKTFECEASGPTLPEAVIRAVTMAAKGAGQ